MRILSLCIFHVGVSSPLKIPEELQGIRDSVPMKTPGDFLVRSDGRITVEFGGQLMTFRLKNRFVMSKELLLFTAAGCGVRSPTAPSIARRLSTMGTIFSFSSRTKTPVEECSFETRAAEYVIKFVDNCSAKKGCKTTGECSLSQTDPLFDEFAFAKFINEKTNGNFVTPDVVAISPPFSPSQFSLDDATEPPGEFEIKFLVDSVSECSDARARFIVERRVGSSVAELMGRFFRPLDKSFSGIEKVIIATKIFDSGMNLLERIHAKDVLHGDIHPGNLALMNFRSDALVQLKLWIAKDPKHILVLIDFGKAKIIPSPPHSSEDLVGMNLALLSPWHLQLEPLGARDDMFRMFEIYLNLISSEGLAIYYSRLEDQSALALARAKLEDDLIGKSQILHEAVSVSEDVRSILQILRSDDYADLRTVYGKIRGLTDQILTKTTDVIIE